MPSHSFALIESLLFIPGSGYVNVRAHLERLNQSSNYFNFDYDKRKLCQKLEEFRNCLPSHEPSKVRLCLFQNGSVELTATSIYEAKAHYTAKRLVFSAEATDAKNIFYFHKTTNRHLYNQEYQRFCIDKDYYEVLFCNQQGFLTEGSRTNVFLKLPHDQTIYTPKLELGLLNGIMRARLLRFSCVREACLTREHVYQAEKIWLTNLYCSLQKVLF